MSATDRPKFADRLIQLVLASAKLFHDREDTYAELESGDVLPLTSIDARRWIARTAHQQLGTSAPSTALAEALTALQGHARHDCEERRVFVRVAGHDGRIVVDLADETHACVDVGPEGWTVAPSPPVMFRRTRAMDALPRPARGGRISDLAPFLNAQEDDLHLILAWMIAALRPDGPFPVLCIHGQQGTAKTTAARVVRAIVDPSRVPVRSPPRTEDDLVIAAQHAHALSYDNLSGVPVWLSDAMCRLSTGGGLSKRTLFTDGDETVISALRPIVVNGIDDIANRADLGERCVVLQLRPIERGRRRDEATFWKEFDAARPRIFGLVLDGLVSALRELPNVHLENAPRMIDFAKWIAAAEPGLGLQPGTLLRAYESNRTHAVRLSLDASPVAVTLLDMLDRKGGKWEGTPEQLLHALNMKALDDTSRDRSWPKSAATLTTQLRRAAPSFRAIGVHLDLDGHRGRGDTKQRWVVVARSAHAEPSTDPAHRVPTNGTANGPSWNPGDDGDDGDDGELVFET